MTYEPRVSSADARHVERPLVSLLQSVFTPYDSDVVVHTLQSELTADTSHCHVVTATSHNVPLTQVWGLSAHPHGHSYVTTGDDGTPTYIHMYTYIILYIILYIVYVCIYAESAHVAPDSDRFAELSTVVLCSRSHFCYHLSCIT
jgi:hypothetical protein